MLRQFYNYKSLKCQPNVVVYQVNIIKRIQNQKYTQLNFSCEILKKNVFVGSYYKIIETRKQLNSTVVL